MIITLIITTTTTTTTTTIIITTITIVWYNITCPIGTLTPNCTNINTRGDLISGSGEHPICKLESYTDSTTTCVCDACKMTSTPTTTITTDTTTDSNGNIITRRLSTESIGMDMVVITTYLWSDFGTAVTSIEQANTLGKCWWYW